MWKVTWFLSVMCFCDYKRLVERHVQSCQHGSIENCSRTSKIHILCTKSILIVVLFLNGTVWRILQEHAKKIIFLFTNRARWRLYVSVKPVLIGCSSRKMLSAQSQCWVQPAPCPMQNGAWLDIYLGLKWKKDWDFMPKPQYCHLLILPKRDCKLMTKITHLLIWEMSPF